ncbi:peroxide stress protein YaaA [Agaribacterium haliotis]|uniref:peroxide stress protein YaaA n=1 Tax=Agaribacterium haliotis TaxID=2013869 RepID=UPI000BB580A1|nr:peroxide stress protein YaaA [Agaribacterium haliotis]
MLSVISPAKNLDFDSPVPSKKSSKAQFLEHSQQLIDELQQLAPHDVSELMGISDKLGVLNYDRFQAWQQPIKGKDARQAVFAFNGDVYTGLDAYSFDDDDLAFAQEQLRILSGLYGLLRPLDLILAYRLEMGTKFQNAGGKDLYEFWGSSLTEALNKQLSKTKSASLVNLASNEYFKAVKNKELQAEIITPQFKDLKNGQYKIISFYAKKARGLMSAYIIKNRLQNADDLLAFDSAGYAYNESLSKADQPVFTRDQAPS